MTSVGQSIAEKNDDKLDTPGVSVIIPSFNYAFVLPRALESVLQQTFNDFELIVVDDGSTDDTKEVIEPYLKDQRIRYIFQKNQGIASARNTGIRAARGRYVAFLDPDDLWLDSKLDRQVSAADEDDEVGLVYCRITFIDETGNPLPDVSWPRPRKTNLETLLYCNWVEGSGSSVLVRKSVFDKVGLFDEALSGLEDANMWLRILHDWRGACVEEPLVLIRRHRKSMQSEKMASNLKKRELELVRHVDRAIELFPELEGSRTSAYHEVYAGLMYMSYVHRRYAGVLRYFMRAIKYRPMFMFTSIFTYLRKYLLRKKRFA